VGDGTTSVVLLAGEILKHVKGFVEDGLHPQVRTPTKRCGLRFFYFRYFVAGLVLVCCSSAAKVAVTAASSVVCCQSAAALLSLFAVVALCRRVVEIDL